MEEYSAWAFALYDFDVRQAGDLAFKAGDLLQVGLSVGDANE